MKGEYFPVYFFLFIVLCFILMLIFAFVEMKYISPVADDKANEHCKEIGFDQYKAYSRVGMWSKDPIGIKCEYAEKYTDLGVRTN